ncbi:hypothetical protein imdm_2062 [gamma proteobacterium IMCC2047]|nr:hypothetical protein imdm_2062 [gamma proteobacterium IMCC2047]
MVRSISAAVLSATVLKQVLSRSGCLIVCLPRATSMPIGVPEFENNVVPI